METYKININSPRLEPRVLVSTDTETTCEVLLYMANDGDSYISFAVDEKLRRGINVGDILYFRKRLGEDVFSELPVRVREITSQGFITDVPGNDEVVRITTADTVVSDTCTGGTIYLDNSYAFLPADYDKLEAYGLAITATTTSVNTEDWTGWTLSPVYRKYNTVCDDDKTDGSKYDLSEINDYAFGVNDTWLGDMEDSVKDSMFPMTFATNINRFFFNPLGDTQSMEGEDVIVYRNLMFDNVEVIKQMGYYELKTNINRCDETNLLKENTIKDIFVSEIKESVIPPFIDMEKMMYEPTLDSSGYEPATEIVFNLNLRVRNDDKAWSIKDGHGWNTADWSVPFDKKLVDWIKNLGFTEDDIHYQKMKVKKSFLRLSFYDTNNPLTQQLLYYSTIFLDSGELFGKYVKEGFNEMRCSFSVKSRLNADKSSEGFYLYLFPSETPKNAPPKEIYMKVEFNHAGYGRTLQMIKPTISLRVNMDEFYEYSFIKLAAKQLPGDLFFYT